VSIVRVHKHLEAFVVLDKTAINDPRLSWKAKGLHVYLLSLPDDWNIVMEDLGNRSSDGRASTRSGMEELLELGYASRTPSRGIGGRLKGWDYDVYEVPQPRDGQEPAEVSTDRPETGQAVNPSDGKVNTTKEPITKEPKIKIWNYISEWKKATGGIIMFGKPGVDALRQLEDMYGHDSVVAAFRRFCGTAERKFGWKTFVQNYNKYGSVHVEVAKPRDIHSD